MPYNERSTGSGAGGGKSLSIAGRPITAGFASAVIAAALFLLLVRFFFGSIRIEAGSK